MQSHLTFLEPICCAVYYIWLHFWSPLQADSHLISGRCCCLPPCADILWTLQIVQPHYRRSHYSKPALSPGSVISILRETVGHVFRLKLSSCKRNHGNFGCSFWPSTSDYQIYQRSSSWYFFLFLKQQLILITFQRSVQRRLERKHGDITGPTKGNCGSSDISDHSLYRMLIFSTCTHNSDSGIWPSSVILQIIVVTRGPLREHIPRSNSPCIKPHLNSPGLDFHLDPVRKVVPLTSFRVCRVFYQNPAN